MSNIYERIAGVTKQPVRIYHDTSRSMITEVATDRDIVGNHFPNQRTGIDKHIHTTQINTIQEEPYFYNKSPLRFRTSGLEMIRWQLPSDTSPPSLATYSYWMSMPAAIDTASRKSFKQFAGGQEMSPMMFMYLKKTLTSLVSDGHTISIGLPEDRQIRLVPDGDRGKISFHFNERNRMEYVGGKMPKVPGMQIFQTPNRTNIIVQNPTLAHPAHNAGLSLFYTVSLANLPPNELISAFHTTALEGNNDEDAFRELIDVRMNWNVLEE